MAINTGVNSSKLVGYAVLAINAGVDASKLDAYAVLSVGLGVDTSKLNAYTVMSSVDTTPPSWPTVFPSGIVGFTYSFSITVGGAMPITLSQISGSTPPGLTLSFSSNVATLSGTPTTAGTYNFTCRAVNANGTTDQPFTVVISPNVTPFAYIIG